MSSYLCCVLSFAGVSSKLVLFNFRIWFINGLCRWNGKLDPEIVQQFFFFFASWKISIFQENVSFMLFVSVILWNMIFHIYKKKVSCCVIWILLRTNINIVNRHYNRWHCFTLDTSNPSWINGKFNKEIDRSLRISCNSGGHFGY